MKFIEIAGKKFKLASRFARLFAFFIDGMFVAGVLSILVFLFDAMGSGIGPSLIRIGLLSALLWTLGPKTEIDEDKFPPVQMSIIALFGPWLNYGLDTLTMGRYSDRGSSPVFHRWLRRWTGTRQKTAVATSAEIEKW